MENKIILYSIDNYEKYVDKIVQEFNINDFYFEIKLILTEALSNAYEHGNGKDRTKPIYLGYSIDNGSVILEIEDSGSGEGDIAIPSDINDDDLLKEDGRGLYLIKCIADEVKLEKNKLIIKKKVF